MTYSGKQLGAIVIVAVLLTATCGVAVYTFAQGYLPWLPPLEDEDEDEDIVIPEDTEFSSLKVNGVREDATSTGVTSATIRIWYDDNFDDVMQYSELGSFTEASGVYTTNDENYPIGEDFEFWVQIYATNHFVTYAQVHMTGVRNSDGSAKMAGEIEVRQVDDALTWSGEANGAAFDTTDYNASVVDGLGTGAGESGTLEAEMILSAADKGLATQVWDGCDYEKAYGIDKDHPYFIKWDEITEGAGDTIAVADASLFAGTFCAAISTTQDKVDLVVDVADFDLYYSNGVDWYNLIFLDDSFGDLFYNTADASAPRPQFSFSFGAATAGGTFMATNGIGIWMDVPYNEMLGGSWDRTAAGHIMGTPGDGWAWTHT